MSEIIVRIEHVRKAGLCTRGARQWFRMRALDYMQFLKDGLPISRIEAVGDSLSAKVCAAAREEHEGTA